MQSFEKRHFIRARADFQVAVELLGRSDEHYPARVSDISIDGIYLFSEAEFTLESKLVLYFPVEWGSIYAFAKVVRRIDNNYGCQFLDVQPSAHKALDAAIYRYWRNNVHSMFPR